MVPKSAKDNEIPLNRKISRRQFIVGTVVLSLSGALSSILAACGGGAPGPTSSATITPQTSGQGGTSGEASLVAVQWGGPYIDSAKPIVEAWAKKNNVTIAWELHAGGAAAILAKIKATWPTVKYDVIAAWDPVFRSMIREGWLETVTTEELPNLKDIPQQLIMKDDNGQMKTVPWGTGGAMWGYRTDQVDGSITSLDDLLNPRFKGKICMPDPIQHTGLAIVSMALHRGGNEKNIDPGFEFLKELAKTGNIGRVASTEADFINSLTTGETAISFWNNGSWSAVSKNFPTTILNRVPDSKAFKGFLWTEGWVILKGPKATLAKQMVNDFLTAPNDETYAAALAEGPANSKSKASEGAAKYFYKADELDKFAYLADLDYISLQLDGWVKRWETEIVPLLKK
jgi:putative spermidine/putrescine transport system substrate-binding protein